MKIQKQEKVNITFTRKELDRIADWMFEQGLNYNKIQDGNLRDNPVGEFYVKINDFLDKED